MRLGIVVVYLFDAKTEYLLGLHLQQIRQHTSIPYKIYGSINRLDAKGRELLSAYPEVVQYELRPTELRRGFEHAFYLDQLVEIAIADGATDVVTLHLDSFPICSDWIHRLKAIADQTGACIAADDCFTACLFFSREFYLRYRPTFRLAHGTPEESQYLEFVKKWEFIPHSGASYLYICHVNRLSWHLLKKTSNGSFKAGCEGQGILQSPLPNVHFGDVFGGILCHLGGAVRQLSELPHANLGKRSLQLRKLAIGAALYIFQHLSSRRVRKWMLQNGPKALRLYVDRFNNQRKFNDPTSEIGFR